jgi:hypothetical protein
LGAALVDAEADVELSRHGTPLGLDP